MSSIYSIPKIKKKTYYYKNNENKKSNLYSKYPTNNYIMNINNNNARTASQYNQCLSEENKILNTSDTMSTYTKRNFYQPYNDYYTVDNRPYNFKPSINNENKNNYITKNYSNLKQNLNLKKTENEISKIKSELSSINSDNLMIKQDIYKYIDINQYIENEIKIQKEHNKNLENKNQTLIKENADLTQQLEQIELEYNELINNKEEKQKIFDENQNTLEYKNEKIYNDYNELILINNKIKNDYNILCLNYEDLNQKNSDINKEIEFMKNAEKNQFDLIDDKIKAIVDQIESLKNERNILIQENGINKNKNENLKKEKADLYDKYQKELIINETLMKKLNNNKIDLNNIKQKLNEKEKFEKNKIENRPKSMNRRKGIIQELKKKIENYKYKSLKNSYIDDDFTF